MLGSFKTAVTNTQKTPVTELIEVISCLIWEKKSASFSFLGVNWQKDRSFCFKRRNMWQRPDTHFIPILKSHCCVMPQSSAAAACSRCVAWEWHQLGNSAEHRLQPCPPLTSTRPPLAEQCHMLKYLLYRLCVPRAWPYVLQQGWETDYHSWRYSW